SARQRPGPSKAQPRGGSPERKEDEGWGAQSRHEEHPCFAEERDQRRAEHASPVGDRGECEQAERDHEVEGDEDGSRSDRDEGGDGHPRAHEECIFTRADKLRPEKNRRQEEEDRSRQTRSLAVGSDIEQNTEEDDLAERRERSG